MNLGNISLSASKSGILNESLLEKNIDVSYLETDPPKLEWKVDTSDKWSYSALKQEANSKITVLNNPTKYNEKMKRKIYLSHYIYREFTRLRKILNKVHDKFLESPDVKDIINKNSPFATDFEANLERITKEFIRKADELHEAWYNDWKEYGDINDFTSISSEVRSAKGEDKDRIIEKYKNMYIELANAGGGDEYNNPLIWWVKNRALPDIDKCKIPTLGDKERFNMKAEYNMEKVKRKLENFLESINTLPSENLNAAYMKIEQILDYVARFGTINYSLNKQNPWSFKKRIDTLEIPTDSGLNLNKIKEALYDIYDAFGDKYNHIRDFVSFAPIYSSYFAPYKTVNGILFELYAIRQNGAFNRNNFDIDEMTTRFNEVVPRLSKPKEVQNVDRWSLGTFFGQLGNKIIGRKDYYAEPQLYDKYADFLKKEGAKIKMAYDKKPDYSKSPKPATEDKKTKNKSKDKKTDDKPTTETKPKSPKDKKAKDETSLTLDFSEDDIGAPYTPIPKAKHRMLDDTALDPTLLMGDDGEEDEDI